MFLFYQQKLFEEFVYLCGDYRIDMKKFQNKIFVEKVPDSGVFFWIFSS